MNYKFQILKNWEEVTGYWIELDGVLRGVCDGRAM